MARRLMRVDRILIMHKMMIGENRGVGAIRIEADAMVLDDNQRLFARNRGSYAYSARCRSEFLRSFERATSIESSTIRTMCSSCL